MDYFGNSYIKNADRYFQANQNKLDEASPAGDITESLIHSLSLSHNKDKKKISDPGRLAHAVSSILEMRREEIVDDKEASSLIRFTITKFVENRFGEIFETVFDTNHTIPSNEDYVNRFHYGR